MARWRITGIFALLLHATILAGFLLQTGIAAAAARKAPEWEISEWINSEPLSVAKLRGKVIVIDFFQLWCPGCNKFSIPLMRHWESVFEKDVSGGRLAFVSIHTVFEGHGYQSPRRLHRFLKEKGITHPVGIDRHIDGHRIPETMRRYSTGGTPEMAIIDKRGFIRFQKLGYFEPAYGEQLIRHLLDEEDLPEKASFARIGLDANPSARRDR